MMLPPVPQTGRKSPAVPDAARLLRREHPQDHRDLFANDPNAEVRQLGRLALRRSEVDDCFALGDLCARLSLTKSDRLLVFYVGKTLLAYRLALSRANSSIDRTMALNALDLYTNWLIDVARINPLRKNIAVVLWALAGEDDADDDTALLEDGAALDTQLINELLTAYRGSPTAAEAAVIERASAPTLRDAVLDDHTVVDSHAPAGISDLTSDVTRADDAVSLPPELDSYVSETRADDHVWNVIPSVEENRVPRVIPTPPVVRRTRVRDESDTYDIGDRIADRFEVVQVKRGGMGVVYLCYDREQRDAVALKTFQTRFLDNERAVRRFMQEAVTWVRLEKHRYIVAAKLVQNINGQPYILLEHVSGPEGLDADLRSWIDHKRLTLEQSIEFGLHIALGMQHATQRVPGLVHRDLKPANILVTHDRSAKVTDFGLVRSLDADDPRFISEDETSSGEPLTRAGAIIGTAPYMSPEQCRSAEVDLRSDIYSFGCLLYEMLTGQHIFPIKKFEAWIHAHLDETPALNGLDDALPELRLLLLTCLAKDPQDRPATWSAVVEQLTAIYTMVTGAPPVLEISGQELAARDLMDKGYSLTELARYDEALEAYDRALALQPNYAWAWSRKGRTLRLSGRLPEALACYDEALRIQPNNASAWKGKGIVYEKLGEMDKALDCHRKANELDPQDAWNWANQSDILRGMGRLSDAQALLEKALSIDAEHAESWAKLGLVLRDLGQLAQALNAYQQSVSLKPTYAWAQNGLGIVLKMMGDQKEALLAFKRATRYDPKEVWYWYHMTDLLVEMRQYDEALAPAQEAVRVDPKHAFSWAKLGQVMRYLRRPDEALKAYDRAIELQSDYAWALNGKGIVLEQLGRHEDALEAYRRTTEIAPGDVWHWYNLGNVYALLGRYDDALPILEQATKVNPNHARTWARMGNVLRQLGLPDAALIAYDRAVTLQPDYAWAWNERGITLEKLGRHTDALESYRHATAAAPEDALYLLQQADNLLALDQVGQAATLLERALQTEIKNGKLWAKLGQVYRRMNKHEDALRAYVQATDHEPNYAWAWNGRGLTLAALGRYDDALMAFRKATELDPVDVWYGYNLGETLVTLGHFRAAAETLEKSTRQHPEHAESWAKLGQAYRRLDQHADALKAYDRALAINDHYAWAWNGRGLALEALSRREEALASYERALAEDTNVIWYYTNLVDLLLDMGKKREALAAIERATAALPDNPTGWARRGQVLRRLSDNRKAVESYRRAIEIEGAYGWAWNGLGLAYAALNQWDDALTAYAEAVKHHPDDAWFWHNYGDAWMMTENYERAVDAFERALRIDPGHEPTRRKLKQARDHLDSES